MWPVQTGRGLQVGKKPPESVARYHLQGRGPNVGSVTAAPQQTEKSHRVVGRHTVVAA